MPAVIVRVLAAVAVVVAVVAIVATAVHLGQLTHPVLGWALVAIVAVVSAWRLTERVIEEAAIRHDRAEAAARHTPDPAPPAPKDVPWAAAVPEPPTRT